MAVGDETGTGVPERASVAVGPQQPGIDRSEFTVAQDTRQTYFSYYWGAVPVWLQVVIVWGIGRLLTTGILAAYASQQPETWQTPSRPDLFTFSSIWDGEWYQRIAQGGYPSELPRGDDGRVTENAWAFMPVFPMLVRMLMVVSGLPFQIVAVFVSLAFGLAATLVFHRLLSRVLDANTAMFATLLFSIAPLSPMLQVSYAESAQLFFLALLLLLLLERRWVIMAPVIVLASLTRPTGLAWAMTLGLYVIYRWWRARAGRDLFPPREQLATVSLGALSVLSGFAWLLIAWAATGEPNAYLDTELAWRSHYTGPGDLVPFTAWFHGGHYWIGWALPDLFGDESFVRTVVSIVVVACVIVGMYAGLALPVMKRLGIEVRLWTVSYLTYLIAVFFPQSSTFRLLLPLFPTLGVVALPRSPIYRIGVVVASIVGQIVWIHWCWFVIGHDWSPP